jgi:phosphohistidine phosphatase
MKTLMLIRHAKSDWSDLKASDFERALNARGIHDAPIMAKRASDRGQIPDAFISSSACRAVQTAKLMAPQLAFPVEQIKWKDELYLASPSMLLDAVRHAPDHAQTLALLAHNPGITDLVNRLCPSAEIENIPTSGIVTLTFNIDNWRETGFAGHLAGFDYPHKKQDD